MTIETTWGVKVKIPEGYKRNDKGYFQNRRGVEYTVVEYSRNGNKTYRLEPIRSRTARTVPLEIAE